MSHRRKAKTQKAVPSKVAESPRVVQVLLYEDKEIELVDESYETLWKAVDKLDPCKFRILRNEVWGFNAYCSLGEDDDSDLWPEQCEHCDDKQ